MGQAKGVPARMMESVDAVNEAQKDVLFKKIHRHFDGALGDKTIAVWGLAFKPRTDDIREAPALVLVEALLAAGAKSASTTPRRSATSASSTAIGSSTAIAPTARSSRPTPWPSPPSGTSSATPTSRSCAG